MKNSIAELRHKLGLTQQDLASQVGVSENTVANWEKGNSLKWLLNSYRLCQALNCRLEDIITNKIDNSFNSRQFELSDFDDIRNYCFAVAYKNNKKINSIRNYAYENESNYSRNLRYWLGEVDKRILQYQKEFSHDIDVDIIVDSIQLQYLSKKLKLKPANEISIDDFKTVVSKINLSDKFMDRKVDFSDENYVRNLIFEDGHLIVYIIGWKKNQIVNIHHHGNSLDAIKVIKGEMMHWLLTPEECDKKNILPEGSKSSTKYNGNEKIMHRAGEFVFVDRRWGHQILNESEQDLVTLIFRFGAPPDDENWQPRKSDKINALKWEQVEELAINL